MPCPYPDNCKRIAQLNLNLKIIEIQLKQNGASAVILANAEGTSYEFNGITSVLQNNNTDVRLFAKPTTRPYRRMGVVLTYDNLQSDINVVKQKAIDLSKQISITINK